MRRLICGVGINDAPYSTLLGHKENGTQIRCPYYQRWKSMLGRCYNPNTYKLLKNARYEFCEVAEEWHRFTNFKSWMEKQDWQGNHLDKDILVPGNLVYGPDTCLFVPPHINMMLIDQPKGQYPSGVGMDKKTKKFFIRVRLNNKKTTRGYWNTPEEAAKEFIKFRYNEIVDAAKSLKDVKLRDALINYANVKYPSMVVL